MSSPEAQADGGGPADIIADAVEEVAELEAAARALIAERERGDELSKEVQQRLLAALTKLYAIQFQTGDRWWPFQHRRAMPATAVMILCNSMLRAINSETFELAIWQAFSGNVAPPQSEDL